MCRTGIGAEGRGQKKGWAKVTLGQRRGKLNNRTATSLATTPPRESSKTTPLLMVGSKELRGDEGKGVGGGKARAIKKRSKSEGETIAQTGGKKRRQERCRRRTSSGFGPCPNKRSKKEWIDKVSAVKIKPSQRKTTGDEITK